MKRQQKQLSLAVGAALLGVTGLDSLAARAQDNVYFSNSDPGQAKSVADWGVDTAWPNFDNVRLSVANIEASNIDTFRVAFDPGQPLVQNSDGSYSLNSTAKSNVDSDRERPGHRTCSAARCPVGRASSIT